MDIITTSTNTDYDVIAKCDEFKPDIEQTTTIDTNNDIIVTKNDNCNRDMIEAKGINIDIGRIPLNVPKSIGGVLTSPIRHGGVGYSTSQKDKKIPDIGDQFKIILPANYKPFKSGYMFKKEFEQYEQTINSNILVCVYYDAINDEKFFMFKDAKTKKNIVGEVVVGNNDESRNWPKCTLSTFHLIDWGRVNEVLTLLLHYYKNKKFKSFVYISSNENNEKFINQYFKLLVDAEIFCFLIGEYTYLM
jgi:hypothetical protein